MVYQRTKIIKGNEYVYEQHSYRENGKVKTQHIRYIGTNKNYTGELGTTQEKNIYESKAEKHFGTTENENEAGYIQTDGKMLDFSGRYNAVGYKDKKVKPNEPDYLKNQRSIDHRQISEVTNYNDNDKYSSIQDYGEKTGSIRFTKVSSDNDINIELFKKPTPQQMTRIKSIQQKNKGKIYADLTYRNEKGNTQSVYGGTSKEYKNYAEFEEDINR